MATVVFVKTNNDTVNCRQASVGVQVYTLWLCVDVASTPCIG